MNSKSYGFDIHLITISFKFKPGYNCISKASRQLWKNVSQFNIAQLLEQATNSKFDELEDKYKAECPEIW